MVLLKDSLIEFIIDDRPYQATQGTNLLDFMLRMGIDLSYFCFHPGLSVAAACRQCLVEIKGNPKLVPACQTMIQPGMAVISNSERVLAARRQMLEFTLVNHPVDCPICDKAGECSLQKLYMEWDVRGSRVDHPKVHKPKRVDLGPRIVLDAERCILCSRCVRFCAEVAKAPQLVIAERGDHSVITTAPGTRLDHPYSLNTVDLCPVGALTDKDFRFKIRVWFLSATLSICNGCATGCPIEIHHHHNRIYRLVPRRFRDINLNWMCDYGRYTYKHQSQDRLMAPQLNNQPTSWDEAFAEVAKQLYRLRNDRAAIGVVLGADVTNEDNFIAAQLAFDFFELNRVYIAAAPDGEGDSILRSADPNPNQAGALACARGQHASVHDLAQDLQQNKLRGLYIVGDALNLPEEILQEVTHLDFLAIQATHHSPLTERSQVLLPARMWEEVDGTITNGKGVTQRLRAAVKAPDGTLPHWQIVVQIAQHLGFKIEPISVQEIFEVMKQTHQLFRQAEWGEEQPAALLRFGGSRG